MTPSQAQELLQRREEDEGPGWVMDLERDLDEADLMSRGECEACGEYCDTPPVCRDCDENGAT